VSKRRLNFAVAAFLGVAAVIRPAAQTPSLEEVLKRSAGYVAEFRKQLSGIVAEETYRQELAATSRFSNNLLVNPPRILKSDLLLIKPGDADRYVELRDVFEKDGEPVRDREARLEALLRDRSGAAGGRIADIIAESAKHNIGGIQRNINTPPSINDRVGYVVGAQRMSISRPTQTQINQYNAAAQDFEAVLAQLRQLIEVDLNRLEKQLEAGGAPWTPGRVPEWKDQ